MNKQVLVINYHEIDAGNKPGLLKTNDAFCVTKEAFEEQLNLLKINAVPIVTLDDLVYNRLTSAFSVAVTVDDGNASDLEIVYPLLKARSVPATFFWLSGDLKNKTLAVEMIENGFTIGSHGLSHTDLTILTPEKQVVELQQSKHQLEELTGQRVNYFALPYGCYNAKILELARQAGYKAVCTTDVGLNNPGDPFLIRRWNVKRTTGLDEFEQMVCNGKLLQQRLKTAGIKKLARGLLGNNMSAKLSALFNS